MSNEEECPEVIYISDEDEDVGEVIDVTDSFWTMMVQLQTVPFEEIRKAGIYRAVQHFINMDYSYRIFVADHDKFLEYQTIQDLMDGVSNYYRVYLPDSPQTKIMLDGLEIIRFHVELEQQIDDMAMSLSNL